MSVKIADRLYRKETQDILKEHIIVMLVFMSALSVVLLYKALCILPLTVVVEWWKSVSLVIRLLWSRVQAVAFAEYVRLSATAFVLKLRLLWQERQVRDDCI